MAIVNSSQRVGAIYRIRVKNHLDTNWERWFDGFTITYQEDGVTTFTGEVVDQSALYGLLLKMQNLNLTLLSVQQIEIDVKERQMKHE